MKDFWTNFVNAFAGENGPLYAAITAIVGVTLGWRFLGNNYSADLNGVKINPRSDRSNLEEASSKTIDNTIDIDE